CDMLGARERQQQLIDGVIEILSRGQHDAGLAPVYVRQGELHMHLGRVEAGAEALGRALELSRSAGDVAGEQAALRSMAFLHWQQGRYEDAVACNERVLELDRTIGNRIAYGRDLMNLAMCLRRLGEEARANACVDESMSIEERHGDPRAEIHALQ